MKAPPMTHNWDTSTHRKDPPWWKHLRLLVIERASGICEHKTEATEHSASARCTYKGDDVDHIINLASGGTDDMSNLQLLCSWHHKQKTAREAAAARSPKSEQRPREKHPGLL